MDIKLKNSKKNKSFFSLLIKNYIAFTVVNIIVLLIIVIAWMIFTSRSLNMPIGTIQSQISILENRDFHKFQVEDIAGANGYIEILDKSGKVIYNSRKTFSRKAYTSREISCIADIENPLFVPELIPVNGTGGKKHLLLIRKSIDIENSKFLSTYEILDDSLTVISGNGGDYSRSIYTQTELDLLMDKSSDGYNRKKYKFTDHEGNIYYLISNSKRLENEDLVHLFGINLRFFFALFLLIYTVSIALFVLWLNRKVKKPLETLNVAFAEYASGNRINHIEYNGAYEFVELCDSFNKMADALTASEQGKQKMLADISHDLKTPITVIKGYAQAIASGVVPEEEHQDYLSTIYQKSENLDELINMFYEFSKIQHPNYTLVKEIEDIGEYVREYLADKYKELTISGFELEVSIPDNPITYEFDVVQLKRVFENIISNTQRHNQKGTIIFFSLSCLEDKIIITIADDGIGIPPELVKNIFSPFVVGDESRTGKQGSGLGLSIGKYIIEAHGGTIDLKYPPTEPYKTEFQIQLPL